MAKNQNAGAEAQPRIEHHHRLAFLRLVLAPARLDQQRGADLETDVRVSFEFFPPKTDKMEATLWTAIDLWMRPLEPHETQPEDNSPPS